MTARKIIDHYRLRPPPSACPFCGDRYGAIEATDEVGLYMYRCWCGIGSKLSATPAELVGLGVPEKNLSRILR